MQNCTTFFILLTLTNILIPGLFISSITKRKQPFTSKTPTGISLHSDQNIPLNCIWKQSVLFMKKCRKKFNVTMVNTSHSSLNKFWDAPSWRIENNIIKSHPDFHSHTCTHTLYLKMTIFSMGEDLISSMCIENRMKTSRGFGILLKLLNLKVN